MAKALKLGGDILGRLTCKAADAVGGISHWPGSLDEVLDVLLDVLHSVWDPFEALLKHYTSGGVNRLDDLFALGFGDGGFLAGRVLKLGGEYSDDALKAIARLGDDLAEAGVKLSDEAARGLGKLVDDVGEETVWRLFQEYSDEAEEVLAIAGRSAVEFSGEATEGLARLVKHSGTEFAEEALGKVAREFSDEIAAQTLSVLSRQTAHWSQEAIDGVAKLINRVDMDTAMGIVKKNGGAEFGGQVFEWVNKLADVPESGEFARWARGLTGAEGGSTYVGAVFEAKYGAEVLHAQGIRTISDVPDGRLGMDFIMNDGRHIELKNWQHYGGSQLRSAEDQFRRNLLKLDASGNPIVDPITGMGQPGRYGDQLYEYVFNGPPNEAVRARLLAVADEARRLGVLTEPFDASNIKFLSNPPFP